MKQLALELSGHPRPIAWTLSEVERAVGDRDRRNMLFTAFEEVTRYIVLVQLARYSEYWATGRKDETVEQRISQLRRPSFGHYVTALAALDDYLAEADDPYSIRASERGRAAAAARLYTATGPTPAKKVSLIGLLSRIVELRNREKGHGYTAQQDARLATEHLQPALTEFLGHTPILLARPLVWIERIEYLDENRWVVTLLELMGTQRARRLTREVQKPGQLKKGFIYMWDGESAPLQLTPFLHLEQTAHDELAYVLAGLAGEPIYQARGTAEKSRTPDQLLTQLTERAPFLLKSPPSVTTPRQPDAARWYRSAVELAMVDGAVSHAEADRLEAMRRELGVPEGEAQVIHAELGWTPAREGPAPMPAAPSSADAGPRSPTGDVVQAAQRFLVSVRDRLGTLAEKYEILVLDPDVETGGKPQLWIQLGRSQGAMVGLAKRRGARVSIVVGFYSLNERRDPSYREAREALKSTGGPALPSGWSAFEVESKVLALAYETCKRVQIEELEQASVVEEVARVTSALVTSASAALESGEEPRPEREQLREVDAPVVVALSDDFPLPHLEGAPRIQGSVWKARILWALEWARRNDPSPKSAADIARILCANGVSVPPTNTARAFRVESDDPRRTGLCEEPEAQRYVITAVGRRALFELLGAMGDAVRR